MDPFSATTAFATLVSLIGQFRAERSGAKQADFNEFMSWLVETNHEELKGLLEQNARTVISIKALLNEQYDAFSRKLELLDDTLTGYASGISGFSELTDALKSNARLSPQALSILRQFESSGASKIIESLTHAGLSLSYIGARGEIEIDDPRFIEDDLNILVDLQLLRPAIASNGSNMYIFTRAASELVNSNRL